MKENPLTMEILLDQLAGLNIIQIAAIPMILLVIAEWILTIVKKKDYYNSIHRSRKCRNISPIKNSHFWSHALLLQPDTLEHTKHMVGIHPLYTRHRFLQVLVTPINPCQPFLVGNTRHPSQFRKIQLVRSF
jgi:hypothetical protein